VLVIFCTPGRKKYNWQPNLYHPGGSRRFYLAGGPGQGYHHYGRGKYFTVEIESHIMGHLKVQDVSVIGLPDERLGEIVAAIILAKPGQTQNNRVRATLLTDGVSFRLFLSAFLTFCLLLFSYECVELPEIRQIPRSLSAWLLKISFL